MLSLHTTIDTQFKTALLYRGTFMASLGLLAMLFASIEIGPALLSKGGIFIFFFGLFAIGYGLMPYRKIMKLELAPHHLFVDQDVMEYVCGKKIERIFKADIQALDFYESKTGYGIRITKQDGSQVTMPFFSKRSYTRLRAQVGRMNYEG